ncbi:MAG: hypothetical protein R3F34_07430 [Planctomycetota bacterium]
MHRLTVRGRIVDPDDRLLSGGPEVSVRMPGARPDGGDWVKSRDARRIEASGRFSAVLRDDEGYVLGHDAEIELFLAPRAMFFWRSSQPLSTERLEYVRLHVVATPLADPYDGAVVDLGDVVPTLLPVAATLEVRSERDESCLVRFFRHDGSGGNGTLGPETLEVPTNRTVEVYGWLDGPDEVWYVEGRAADGSERRVFAPWISRNPATTSSRRSPSRRRCASSFPRDRRGEGRNRLPEVEVRPAQVGRVLRRCEERAPRIDDPRLLDPLRPAEHRNVLGDFYPPYEFDEFAPGDYVLEVWDAADVSKGPALSAAS